ncbi:hypothetical protein EDEG_02921 [Edhazardia aedis USNM 41457]|uniref:Uncharacterized protein n=1 Tax=Edhazardia aedis (strain USNM 41457) TaxID=1003232 RepID=J9D584_EDHAE|nr:hypothetical protein EDEG_02921 [Edhazardia aedis USNM 41457]|eukprot:EJW02689.1 hypothetical protein EDEG_02921 [Edhazardia aedis USNM 41457]
MPLEDLFGFGDFTEDTNSKSGAQNLSIQSVSEMCIKYLSNIYPINESSHEHADSYNKLDNNGDLTTPMCSLNLKELLSMIQDEFKKPNQFDSKTKIPTESISEILKRLNNILDGDSLVQNFQTN